MFECVNWNLNLEWTINSRYHVKTQGVLKDNSLIKNGPSKKISTHCGENNFNTTALPEIVFSCCTASYTWCLKNQQLWSIKRVLLFNCCCFLKAWGLSRNTLKYFIKFFQHFLIPVIILLSPLSILHLNSQKISELKRRFLLR